MIGKNSRFDKLISDVNTTYEDGVQIGIEHGEMKKEITVVGWNNRVPAGTRLGKGVTVTPRLDRNKGPALVEAGRVLK